MHPTGICLCHPLKKQSIFSQHYKLTRKIVKATILWSENCNNYEDETHNSSFPIK